MEFGKRLAQASALTATVALAAIVGNAQASPLPPKSVAAVPGAMAAPAPEPAPAVPTFVNGLAQNVFSAASADWISGEVWVESDFDTDGDGKLDRLHADYTLPKETLDRRPEGPGHLRGQPVLRRHRRRTTRNWGVDHELGAQPPARPFAPFFDGTQHEPDDQQRSTSRTWLPRGFAVVHSESPGTGYSDGCPTSGGRNETLGATDVIDWLNGRRKAYTTRTGDVEAPPVNWHNGHTAMMGTSYNGTIPDRRRHHRRQRPRRDRPDLGDLRLVRLLPRQRHGPRAALRRRRHRQQLLPRRGPRRARRRRLLAPRRAQPARPPRSAARR